MPYVNHNKKTPWTREMILEKLATDSRWVERAIVSLYDRQVALEKAAKTTIYDNDKGYQVADARMFSEYAQQIKRQARKGIPEGLRLTKEQLAFARRPWHRGTRPIPTIAKYRKQILQMIEDAA